MRAADALQVDVEVACLAAHEHERLALGRDARVAERARLDGELAETRRRWRRRGRRRTRRERAEREPAANSEARRAASAGDARCSRGGPERAELRPGAAARASPTAPRGRTRGRAPTGSAARAPSPGSAARSARARREPRRPARGLGHLERVVPQDRRHRLGRGLALERAARPSSISYSTEPSEKMSERWSTACAAHLLGRHVADRAEHGAGLGLVRFAWASSLWLPAGPRRDLAREAEVEDLHAAVAGEEDVLGLEVAVDDALLVRGGEAVRRSAIAHSAALRDRAARRSSAARAASRPRAAP